MIFLRSSVKSVCGEGDDAVVVRLGAAHHALAPPVLDDGLRRLDAGPVEAVERARRQRAVELRPVGGELRLEVVEHALGQALRVGVGLHHERRHRADDRGLGDAALAVAGEVVHDLAAAGGVPDVDGVVQVEVVDHGGEVVGVVVHVVAVGDLGRAPVTAPVVGDRRGSPR